MGGLWGDFNAIFWIAEYFTKANKKFGIEFKMQYVAMWNEFSIYPITYSLQLSTF
jgi:hypothetical protein